MTLRAPTPITTTRNTGRESLGKVFTAACMRFIMRELRSHVSKADTSLKKNRHLNSGRVSTRGSFESEHRGVRHCAEALRGPDRRQAAVTPRGRSQADLDRLCSRCLLRGCGQHAGFPAVMASMFRSISHAAESPSHQVLRGSSDRPLRPSGRCLPGRVVSACGRAKPPGEDAHPLTRQGSQDVSC